MSEKQEFEINKKVPLPDGWEKSLGPRGSYNHYPFDTMGIGDSFIVELTDNEVEQFKHNRQPARVRGALAYFHRKNPDKFFVTRTIDDGRKIRIWRAK